MEQRKDGKPGFAISIPGLGDNGAGGISLRDWFAGQAVHGVLGRASSEPLSWADISEASYRISDSMLAERAKTGTATVPLDRKQYDAPAELIPTTLTNAAPEMYAALQEIVAVADSETVDFEGARAAVQKARTALRKARTGEWL